MRKLLTRVLVSERVWILICLLLGMSEAWSSRHQMNPDGLSYIDMASNAGLVGPQALVNGLWSPGYPALLALGLWIFEPSPDSLIPFVHGVNAFLYLVALVMFALFLRTVIECSIGTAGDLPSENLTYGVPIAYSTFILLICASTGPDLVAPDTSAAAITFGAAICILRLASSAGSLRWATLLGLSLGLAYYFRSAMFPLGILVLSCLPFLDWPARVRWRPALVAAAAFILIALPLASSISARVGKLTFGTAGSLNYAWHVNRVPPPWGADVGALPTTLTHPPRLMVGSPLTIEFSTPVPGTFPLWYDPSYWYAGVQPRLDLVQQVRVLARGVGDVARIFYDAMPLLAAATALWLALKNPPSSSRRSRGAMLVLAWAGAAVLMYSLIHVEIRYVAVFIAIVSVLGFRALLARSEARSALIAAVCVALTIVGPYSREVKLRTKRASLPTHPTYLAERDALLSQGINRGDVIAVVGYSFDSYYARAAGVRIGAQILDIEKLSALDATEFSELGNRLRAVGVSAVVARHLPRRLPQREWKYSDLPDSSTIGIWTMTPAQ